MNDFYQTMAGLASEIADHAYGTFMISDSAEAVRLAEKVANLVPADQMPLNMVSRLLTFFRAPLMAANEMARYAPINYKSDLMAVTLAAEKFHSGVLAGHPAISTHGERVAYLVRDHPHDSYDPQAMHMMIHGLPDATKLEDRSLRPHVDLGALVSILVFRPELILEHNLTEVFLDNLPFEKVQNQKLVEKVLNKYAPSGMDPLIRSLAEAKLPLDLKIFAKLFDLQESDPKLQNIHLIAVAFDAATPSYDGSESRVKGFVV